MEERAPGHHRASKRSLPRCTVLPLHSLAVGGTPSSQSARFHLHFLAVIDGNLLPRFLLDRGKFFTWMTRNVMKHLLCDFPTFNRSTASSRRESKTGLPPSTDHRGSIHNLQLDIMDDIVQARKARMKLWNTSNEKVCEVQTLDEAGAGSSSPMRYTNRRYSDFVGTTLPPIQSFRRASEMPISPSAPLTPATASSKLITASPKPTKMGIVCTNTDLISLLSSLASSATEINRCGDKDYPTPQTPQSSSSFKSITKIPPDASGSNLKKNRSNSFDISLYHNIKQLATGSSTSATEQEKSSIEPGWFAKRHQPMDRKKSMKSPNATVSFAKEAIDKLREKSDPKSGETKAKPKESRSPLSKLKWDGRSAIVDARMIGHAIENFITGSSSSKKSSGSKDSPAKPKKPSSSSWFGKTDDDDSNDTCDSSLCSTLKDLFVK